MKVVIGAWRKSVGQRVERDEEIVELETDKATFDLPAPAAGVLTKIVKQAGETATIGEVIGYVGDGAGGDMDVDVQTGKAAGVPVWLVPGGATGVEAAAAAGADRVLTGFAELLDLLPGG